MREFFNQVEQSFVGNCDNKMGKIIFCSDLVLRIDNDHEEISNVTEWLLTSTDFRPAYPDGCVIRNEMSTMGKVCVILLVWSALVILTTFYCYFCEQRLFQAKQKLLEQKQPLTLSKDDLSSTIITSSSDSKCCSINDSSSVTSSYAGTPTSPANKHFMHNSSSQASLLSSPIRGSKVPYFVLLSDALSTP